MPVGHSVTVDGSLSDWFTTDRVDDGSVAGYEVYATTDSGDFVFALKSNSAIGPNTTAYFNTDRNAATGEQIFGWAGGAEYKVNFDADGTVNLYNAAGTKISALTAVWSADHTVVEFRVSSAAIGNPAAMGTLYDFNDTAFVPGNFALQYTVFNDTGVTQAADTRIAIVYSDTTAAAYFSKTAYSQLFMSAQSQAMQAGIPYDILTENDLTNLATLAKYDAIVFPSFRNVQQANATAIMNTLEQASKQLGIGLITAGEFMTNAADGAPLAGDPYAAMKLLFDVTRVDGGTGNLTITATDASGQILDGYTNGQVVNNYSGVGWNAFASVNGTGTTIATETVNGANTYAAAIATNSGNVIFSTEGVMADANLLQKAIDYSVNGTGISVGLQLTREAGIVAARVDMDQSQEVEDVNPTNGSPGIYDKLLPILSQWKAAYNFVGSYYVNVGNNANQGQTTDWSVSGPIYKALIDMGNEIGSHSYTHPENTNTLTPEQIQFEFQQSTSVLNTQISAALGSTYTIVGAAVPGAPETLATSEAILPYVQNYLTGGYAAQGAGYPNAFGYLAPDQQSKIYLAPNTSFDFTLVEFQHKSVADASAAWAAEFNKLVSEAETPVIVWPFHDYGAADWNSDNPNSDSPYSTQMFTDWIARAAAADMEFVTLEDLASRMSTLKSATVTTSISGNTITANVTSGSVGDMALDVDGQGTQVIKSVNGWYAYDNDSVFLPQSGGTFTITLGAAQDDVTHITALPMRAVLLSTSGNGQNLSFSLQGEGKVVVDLAASLVGTVAVSGATVVSQVGEIMTLDVGANGLHNVTLTYVGHPPVITSDGGGATATISRAENGTSVTTVTATDPDAGTTLAYSISGGADQAKFTINATTGVLAFLAAPNFDIPGDSGGNNVYDVVVRASDGTLFDEQAIAVTITNLNEAPIISSNGGGATANLSMAENQTAVTTVVATDPDAGTTLGYSIVGGADAAKFTINATTGALAFLTAPNFEVRGDVGANNVYNVTVRASDGTLFDDQALAITITNANEAPVITSNGGGPTAAISIAENIRAVTTVTASDVDSGTTMRYSIVGGADLSKFTINSTSGALSFVSAPNFEAPGDSGGNNIYDIVVRASDGALFDDQAIAVTITNASEAPIISSNGGGATATIQVRENTAAVTTVLATDPDNPANPINYSIVAGADASLFTINPTTGVMTFVAAPDYEAPTDAGANNVYNVTVRASDGTLFDDQALSVSVTNATGLTLTALSTGSILTGSGEEDDITGQAGADTFFGLGGNDRLAGNNGADTLDGGAGNDQLIGGAGADRLTGGAGADTFIYRALNQSTVAAPDIITDFTEGVDRINLSGIDANTANSSDQAFSFIGTAGAFTAVGQVRYFVDGAGDTVILGNSDSNPATAEFSIKLLGSHVLSASDFIL